jgi:hypothetical protein
MLDAASQAEIRTRLEPAGAGAIRFAFYFVLGGCGLGMVMAPILEAADPGSALHVSLVVLQALLVVGWLVFVVTKAVRGGLAVWSPGSVVVTRFLLPKRHLLSGEVRTARFTTRSQGRTYFVGPTLLFTTREGKTVSVACIAQDLHERLGLALEDDAIVAPMVVISPESFAEVQRMMMPAQASPECLG